MTCIYEILKYTIILVLWLVDIIEVVSIERHTRMDHVVWFSKVLTSMIDKQIIT